jgi:hypothetical protein
VKTPQANDLAQYAQDAFNKLAKAKAGAKSKAKAASKAGATAKANAAPKIQKNMSKAVAKPGPKAGQAKPQDFGYYGTPGPRGPFGCVRCKGNTKGCETCIQPGFKGLRFKSRDQWAKYKMALGGNLK